MSYESAFAVVCSWVVLLLLVSIFINSRNNKLWLNKEKSGSAITEEETPEPPLAIYYPPSLNLSEYYQNNSNIPKSYWNNEKVTKYYKNTSCAKYPTIAEIEFNNIYWQVLRTKNGTFYFYNAYYDVRNIYSIPPTVRILSMIDRYEPKVKTFCQVWFYNISEPVIVEVLKYTYIWYRSWGNANQGVLQPYLLSCEIPDLYKNLVPESVSIVENKCDTASNNLKVIFYLPTQKKDFLVCVKGLEYPNTDISERLVEWIELLNILGASKIMFYELKVHPNISKVLMHYSGTGFVEVAPLTLPGRQPNYPILQNIYLANCVNNKRQNELIPYNDCFYKNMYSYEYIVLLDIDEVIIPKVELNWKSLVEKVSNKSRQVLKEPISSFCARNVYFFDYCPNIKGWFKEIPRHMHMLQHVYRSGNYSRPYHFGKCFFDPQYILALHNHFVRAHLRPRCTKTAIEIEEAQLHHYRADCHYRQDCEAHYKATIVTDTSIWKFRDSLILRTENTLKQLGFL